MGVPGLGDVLVCECHSAIDGYVDEKVHVDTSPTNIDSASPKPVWGVIAPS